MLLDSLFKGNTPTNGKKQIAMLDGSAPIFSQFGRDIYASDVVQQCIDCIASEFSKLVPQHVVVDDTGLPSPVKSDNFNRLFKFKPNELMTTAEFLEKTAWLSYLNYNVFIYPVYSVDLMGNRTYTAFYPLNPLEVAFLQDDSGTMFTKFTFANGYSCTLPYSDIIHIRKKYSMNDIMGGGIHGKPDNAALLQTLQINDTVLQGMGKAIKSSLSVRGVIKLNTILDDPKQEAERKAFEEKLSNNESGIIPLDLKNEFTPITMDPKFVDATTLNFLENKILRWFGVSLPILSGDYTEEQKQAFYDKTIAPFANRFFQAFSSCIFSQRQQDVGHEIRLYQMNLELMDTKAKLAFATQLGDRGILTDNQIAGLFGYPPRDDGNVRHMSLNYINANLADQYQLLKVKGNLNDNGGNSSEK